MKILVTGYLDTEDMLPEHVDLDHESGLSAIGHERFSAALGLGDIEFEAVAE